VPGSRRHPRRSSDRAFPRRSGSARVAAEPGGVVRSQAYVAEIADLGEVLPSRDAREIAVESIAPTVERTLELADPPELSRVQLVRSVTTDIVESSQSCFAPYDHDGVVAQLRDEVRSCLRNVRRGSRQVPGRGAKVERTRDGGLVRRISARRPTLSSWRHHAYCAIDSGCRARRPAPERRNRAGEVIGSPVVGRRRVRTRSRGERLGDDEELLGSEVVS
jgi:hypothetical protein